MVLLCGLLFALFLTIRLSRGQSFIPGYLGPIRDEDSKLANQEEVPFTTRVGSTKIPDVPEGGPLDVFVGFYIESLGNIKETQMAYDLDIYLYQNWFDGRLAHNSSLLKISDRESLTGIWLPDLYFANAKSAHFQTVTVPNFVLYIYPDGTVAYSTRITMNLACNMDLKRYPLDSQTCMVKITSYGHTHDTMRVKWFKRNPLAYDNAIDLPELYITELKSEYCDGTYRYAITEHLPELRGKFSCLIAKIELTRALGYHLVQTYIPTAMIVIISWVSFWIDPTAVPARVSLSFTTLLTLSTQGAGLQYTLPPVSYAKAIDFWYGTCMLFLFAALLEFAVVNTMMRRAKKCQDNHISNGCSKRRRDDKNQMEIVSDVMSCLLLSRGVDTNRYARNARKIDKTCRIAFPGSFISFLLFYWIYYKFL